MSARQPKTCGLHPKERIIMNMTAQPVSAIIAILIAACSGVGCYGRATLQPSAYSNYPAYSEAEYGYETVPANIVAQPYVVYEGARTYYVNGRWYRNTPRGWGYYRNEPAPLVRRRPYVQSAPPAYGGPRRGSPQEAPPAYRR
jgi:hypothetical protein